MASQLKELSKRLRRQYGKLLIATFNEGFAPGSVLEARSWNDLNLVGHLNKTIPKAELPELVGPTTVLFGNFEREHELNIGGALDLIQPNASAKSKFKKAKSSQATFESLLATSYDLFELSDLLRSRDSFWTTTLGETMQERRTRICYQAIRGKITFSFQGSGEALIDMKATVGNLRSAGIDSGWKWRNNFLLESKKEVTIAIETARWHQGKRRLTPMKSKI